MAQTLNIQPRWISIESNSGTAYRYPVLVTPRMKAAFGGPAVYRWLVTSPNSELLAIYFGQTESLARRVSHYVAPGKSQQTNIRLKSYFDQKLGEHCAVALETLDFDPFFIGKFEVDRGSLRHSFVRAFLESFVVTEFHGSGSTCYLLNRLQDATENLENEKLREVRGALKGMLPEQRNEILKRAQS